MARRSLSKDTTTVRQRLDGHAIVLVGLMGAGKTTVGRRLAEKLGLAFVDADHEIELYATAEDAYAYRNPTVRPELLVGPLIDWAKKVTAR